MIQWLEYYNQKIILIQTSSEFLSFFRKNLRLDGFTFWYRRSPKNDFLDDLEFHSKSASELRKEYQVLEKYYHSKIPNHKTISHPDNNSLNKLIVLDLARDCGIKTPHSRIVTNKNEVSEFIKENTEVITKPLFEVISKREGNDILYVYTSVVELEDIKETDFFPSLLQNKIKKEFEIRVFYFFGDFYSIAIFSQNKDSTSVDFRIYDYKKPNRNVVINLPQSLREKLKNLMDKVGLKTGSIDLIFTPRKEMVFLEINPVGQFGMVSRAGNFNLEKIIAEKLIELNEK